MFHFLCRLTNDLADCISEMIVSIFPTEVVTTYYVPPTSKKDSVTRKSIISRGKLINMWRNRHALNRKFEARIKKENSEREEPGNFNLHKYKDVFVIIFEISLIYNCFQ